MKLAIQLARDESGRYWAKCPVLPGCVARGGSEEEAMARMDVAVQSYLASFDAAAEVELEQEFVTA